jgi:hypothetical protein
VTQLRIQPAVPASLIAAATATTVFLAAARTASVQTTTPRLAWDEAAPTAISGFAVIVDGVRADYALTPLAPDGSCGCSIPLPFTSGRHIVTVNAYNAAGETPSAQFVVGPTAVPGGPYSGQVGGSVNVSGAGSIDSIGTITTYSWNWGDSSPNTSSATPAATHSYSIGGTFTITLTVADNFAGTHSATTTATIASAAVPDTPTSPTPPNGATAVGTTPTLTWTAVGATSYDVRFGTTNPPPVVVTNRTTASYAPGQLSADTTFFWQIVARTAIGATTGPVWSFKSAASSTTDIVIYASDIPQSNLHGSWTFAPDRSAANGIVLTTPDIGWSTLSAPLAAPVNYVDATFSPAAGVPYTLWLRLHASNNSKRNDSLWVQFSDALVNGGAIYPINSTTGLVVNLATDGSGKSLNGWGWTHGAYWLAQPATFVFTAATSHTLRIQIREDGVQFDQIVLSPRTYLSSSPGRASNDSTIVPK